MLLPTGWRKVGLEEAYWFQEGPGVRKWQFMNFGIKLLNVANIEKTGQLNLSKTDRHLSVDEVESRYQHFLIDEGDLVIASSGISFDQDGLLRTRGAFVESQHLPLCLNTSTIRFKAKSGASDLTFLKHWLDSREFREQITKLVTGSAQQNFGPSHLKATQITLPPLPEQRRIAAILDQADALRTKRREALAQLDSLTQSIFIDMFGDPVDNEKGIPSFFFDEVTVATQGVQIPREEQAEEPRDGYERYLYINDFYSDSSPKYIKGRYPQKRVTENDLVMANTGSPGRVFRGRSGVLSNNLFRISFDTKIISTDYFYHFLASHRFQQHLKGQMKQGIQSHLGHKTFGKQVLPLPSMQLQNEFTRRIAKCETLRQSHQVCQQELERLFASLQHRAFRGEL